MKDKATKYNAESNHLEIGDIAIKFEYNIKQVLEVADMLILLMIGQDGYFPAENVYGISLSERKIRWRIAKLKYETGEVCPFVGMKFDKNRLYLNNWCDIYLIVDPFTGEILERSGPAKY